MQSKDIRTIDKSDWGSGVWQDEPDEMQWEDTETGFPCLIHRTEMGHLCGYVGVAKVHPLFEVKYGDAPNALHDVHGGLTFSGTFSEHKEVWWFWF